MSNTWAETAPCHIVTSRPEGTKLYLQRGFIFSAEGPVALGEQYLDETTRSTPVKQLWSPAAEAAGWELIGEPRLSGPLTYRLTAGRRA